ncbi:protein-disulfide reductase DsbD [bacterium]|nr:protein-disulfide reductase DsbD [candidate division CSSED10-310 bacterium]
MKKLTTVCLLLLMIVSVRAQSVPEVTILGMSSHDSIPSGQDFTLFVQFTIPAKHHLTSNFFEVQLEELPGFSFGLQQFSPGEFHKGEVIRRDKAAMQVVVTVGSEVNPGEYTIKGKAVYQICREEPPETCFPPAEHDFSVKFTVLDKSASPAKNDSADSLNKIFSGQSGSSAASESDTEPNSGSDRLQTALQGNLALAFFLVFLAGIGISLTPCVYPMIPITISYIGGKSTGQGKLKGFVLSLFYVLGLALIYAILGVAAALTGSLFGSITQTPWVIGGVAIIFGIMGLSMLGLFDIQLPSAFQGKIQSGGPKSGYFGSVIMGMIAGLVAAPCAGPAIVALMTFIASTGNIFLGFTLMMTFAFGMGLLFIALGTFSGLLSALPDAGMWMEKVKKVFGIIMIGAALFIVKPLLPPPVFGFLTGLGLLLLGAGMGAFRPLAAADSHGRDLWKGIAILLVVSGIYFMISLLPVPGKIVPEMAASKQTLSSESEASNWRSDLLSAINDAKKLNKPILLDFGAEWCVQCKELEHKTFADPQVKRRLADMIAVKVDCTKARDDKVKATLAEYTVNGLPTVILLDAQAQELGRFTGFLPPDGFLGFLEQSLSSDTLRIE